jgi:dTDP-4-amino-4,6-dideoxygalactose transaminase
MLNACGNAFSAWRAQMRGRLRTRGNVVRAVIPVHLLGPAAIWMPCGGGGAYDLPIIEDAAQAFGAGYRSAGVARCAGSIADFAFFSFFPTKNLGGAGDGGMAVCRDRTFAEKLRLLRNHGMGERYFHRVVGGNFRLDALPAAVPGQASVCRRGSPREGELQHV